jgi:hypothetical protein
VSTETREEITASRVASRHVLTEGYLTIYTDGSYVLCRWQVAP